MKHKKLLAGAVFTILILAGVLLLYRQAGEHNNNAGTTSSPPAASDPNPLPPETPSDSLVTKTGTIDCLSHIKSDGPQTMECAIGLLTDDGAAYALHSSDPTVVGSIPTGQRVTVTGTIRKHETTYRSEGTIEVQSIER